jgi:iron complex transport system substrate-binding protein
LEKYGITVIAIDPQSIKQVARDILMVGRATNRDREAWAAADKIADAFNFVKKKAVGARSKPHVLFAVQADPLWAAGPHTFIDEIIRMAGGQNLASNAKPGFRQFSVEAAISQHPDVIIGTDKGSRQIFTHGMWESTRAAQTGQVYEVDPDIVVRAGPRLSVAILTLARLIHPELYNKK